MQDLTKVSVVIPVYGSATILPDLALRLEAALLEFAGKGAFELILVNDCSPDNAWAVIVDLAKMYPWLRGINLAKNRSEEHTSELQSLMRISYAVFCLKKKKKYKTNHKKYNTIQHTTNSMNT